MAVYKVSYSMLSQQGEELKKLAKLIDGYAERINGVKGKLGDDQLLAQVRANLGTLGAQLGETRAVMNTAGELLSKTVEGYTASETRQVKKVDSLKAHNRDFYKNPVVVASAGGASGTAAAVPTMQYTDNSTTLNYYAAAPDTATAPANTVHTAAGTMGAGAKGAAQDGVLGGAGLAAGVGVAGGVVGAGLVQGALYLKQNKDKKGSPDSVKAQDDDLEERLARARERVEFLNGQENE